MISLAINNVEVSPDVTIFNVSYFIPLIFEIILAILHPNIWTKGIYLLYRFEIRY